MLLGIGCGIPIVIVREVVISQLKFTENLDVFVFSEAVKSICPQFISSQFSHFSHSFQTSMNRDLLLLVDRLLIESINLLLHDGTLLLVGFSEFIHVCYSLQPVLSPLSVVLGLLAFRLRLWRLFSLGIGIGIRLWTHAVRELIVVLLEEILQMLKPLLVILISFEIKVVLTVN